MKLKIRYNAEISIVLLSIVFRLLDEYHSWSSSCYSAVFQLCYDYLVNDCKCLKNQVIPKE